MLKLQEVLAVALRNLWNLGVRHCDNHLMNIMIKSYKGKSEKLKKMVIARDQELGRLQAETQIFSARDRKTTVLLHEGAVVFIDPSFMNSVVPGEMVCDLWPQTDIYQIMVPWCDSQRLDLPHGRIISKMFGLFDLLKEVELIPTAEMGRLESIIIQLGRIRDEEIRRYRTKRGYTQPVFRRKVASINKAPSAVKHIALPPVKSSTIRSK